MSKQAEKNILYELRARRDAARELADCAPELLEALVYVRRFVKASDVDIEFVDRIIAKVNAAQTARVDASKEVA